MKAWLVVEDERGNLTIAIGHTSDMRIETGAPMWEYFKPYPDRSEFTVNATIVCSEITSTDPAMRGNDGV